MMNQIRELEERFLEKDVETGIFGVDNPDVETMEQGEFSEADALVGIVQNSAESAYLGIEQLLKHKGKATELFGEQGEEVLKDAKECLQALLAVFSGEEPEEELEDTPEEEVPTEKEVPAEKPTEEVPDLEAPEEEEK